MRINSTKWANCESLKGYVEFFLYLCRSVYGCCLVKAKLVATALISTFVTSIL